MLTVYKVFGVLFAAPASVIFPPPVETFFDAALLSCIPVAGGWEESAELGFAFVIVALVVLLHQGYRQKAVVLISNRSSALEGAVEDEFIKYPYESMDYHHERCLIAGAAI